MLHYNASIGEILLEVDVSNTPSPGRPAEDAHVAALNVTIPPSLIYSKVRTKVKNPENVVWFLAGTTNKTGYKLNLNLCLND